MTEVAVTMSEPYTVIAGGWTGMRPVGRRRDYRAEVDGTTFCCTSKAEIQRAIRARLYGTGNRGPVRFTFTEENRS
jgi:hypothetical protein